MLRLVTATDTATALDRLCVDTIRTLSMDGVQKANSGHPGTPMALAPVAYVLYARVMRHSPHDPDWPDRDRFVLSCGHASMLLYSTLYLAGYDVSLEDDIMRFRQLGSRAAGHPEYRDLPGIEVTTGPLGQGISHAVGMALAERMLATRFNRPGHEIVDHRTFVIASDGDLEEGISGEASSIAGHLGLGRLISFYDQNHISIEGDTKLAFTEDVGKRYEALRLARPGPRGGHRARQPAASARERDRRRGQAVADHRPHAHRAGQPEQARHRRRARLAARRGGGQAHQAGDAAGPRSSRSTFRRRRSTHFRRCVERGEESRTSGTSGSTPTRQEHPELAEEFERLVARKLPDGWDAEVPRFHASGTMTATRKSSQTVLQWAAAKVPELVGGSADLAPSTLTLIDGAGSVEAGAYDGRNLHFGIREHAMGAIVNGMTLHYLRAYGSTFFTLQRLHARLDPARRADEAAVDLRASPTTRSVSARTGRRISRSSSSRGCGRCRC